MINLNHHTQTIAEIIALANQALQQCVIEMYQREQREVEAQKNKAEMFHAEQNIPEFLKKDNLQWTKFSEAVPTEPGIYVFANSENKSPHIFILTKRGLINKNDTVWTDIWIKLPDIKG